jgi:nicotinic acid mononucleotide adenylyltransferase
MTEFNKKYDVVFSYQGAFGPPTYGHYKSMEAFAQKLSTDFSDKSVLMLFMPTAGGSKTHLQPTRDTRKTVLDMFCILLMNLFPNITFETSPIENEIFDNESTKGKTATIYTIDKLKTKYPESTICLGMGLDNAYQLPYWERVDEYSTKVQKIYVVPRNPTQEELEKTRRFNVTNQDNSVVELRFDVTVPWTNSTFLKCFLPSGSNITVKKGEKENLIAGLKSVNNDSNEPFIFYQQLPPVVVLEDTSIPATSSSMMRYFIGQYVKNIDKEANLMKIRKLMFGPAITEPQKVGVDTTITDYETNVFKIPKDNNYDAEYQKISEFVGGNRKTQRRRRGNKKRRSQRK